MKLMYFAWLRERAGQGEETVSPPEEVRDVAGLLDWLKARGPAPLSEALAEPQRIRVAVNQEYADMAAPVAEGDEIALFPPVTGG